MSTRLHSTLLLSQRRVVKFWLSFTLAFLTGLTACSRSSDPSATDTPAIDGLEMTASTMHGNSVDVLEVSVGRLLITTVPIVGGYIVQIGDSLIVYASCLRSEPDRHAVFKSVQFYIESQRVESVDGTSRYEGRAYVEDHAYGGGKSYIANVSIQITKFGPDSISASGLLEEVSGRRGVLHMHDAIVFRNAYFSALDTTESLRERMDVGFRGRIDLR